MRQRHKPAWRRHFDLLRHGSDFDAVEASKTLSRSRSHQCMDALVALMHRYDAPFASKMAAYALSWMCNRRFVRDFAACLRDTHQHEDVRAQAAEGLGLLYGCPVSRSKEWRIAEKALLDMLADPSPAVRFWCCYGLGAIRSERAIAPLEQLREHDTTLAPGWWYVREEAADALEWIAGRPGEERVAVHLRPLEAV